MLSWTFGMDPKKFGPIDWRRTRQSIPLSEIRREMATEWSIPQKMEKVSTSETDTRNKGLLRAEHSVLEDVRAKHSVLEDIGKSIAEKEQFYPLSKIAYQSIVKTKRREHVHSLFLEELEQVFNQLEDKAMQMIDCHFEVSFDIKEAYDIDKVEILLRDYFLDLEFDVIVAERNDEQSDRKVVFTLT